jgi:hypothetical protein
MRYRADRRYVQSFGNRPYLAGASIVSASNAHERNAHASITPAWNASRDARRR